MTDAENIARLQADADAATASGFVVQPPVVALGTRVNATGRANFTYSRHQFDNLPRASEALATFRDAIIAECRRSRIVPLPALRMLDNGAITQGNGPATVNPKSLGNLLRRTTFPEPGAAAKYMAEIPSERRAKEFNAIVKTHGHENGTPVDVQLRLRKTTGLPEIFHAASPSYTPFDPDQVAQGFLSEELFPGDCRAEIVYDGYRFRLSLLWHSNVPMELVSAGEIFKAYAGFTSADDGSRALYPVAGLFRNLCLNLIIVQHAEQQLSRRVHRGDTHDMATWVASALSAATDKVRYFAELWDGGRATPVKALVRDVPEGRTVDAPDVFRSLLESKRLTLPAHNKQAAFAQLVNAWAKEPEPNLVGVVNAITRTAHEAPLPLWAGEELEATAGELLTQLPRKPLDYVSPDSF